MPRNIYSAVLFEGTDISGTAELSTVPTTETWVARFMASTFGTFAGYVRTALADNPGGPWLWLNTSRQTSIIGVSKQTFYWEGRMVFEPGVTMYAQVDSPDTCDLYVSGYRLIN